MVKRRLIPVLFLAAIAAFAAGCAKCSEKNEEPATAAITLNAERLKLNVGDSFTLKADKELTEDAFWYSYDASVAEVDALGNVVAAGTGVTTVLLTDGDLSASCNVTVVEKRVDAKNLALSMNVYSAVVNAESQNDTIKLTAQPLFNGVKADCEVEWQCSDEDFVVTKTDACSASVKALKNGKSCVITAVAKYNGITATATVKIIAERFAFILPKTEELFLFENESQTIEFEVYEGGTPIGASKAETEFTSSDETIATVDENGTVTAKAHGVAQITLKYASKTATVKISVGETVYVSDASGFLAMDGADRTRRFVLNSDVDMRDCFSGANALGAKSFISYFDGALLGNGYTVYGLLRYSSDKDDGFDGIFGELGENALVSDVKFIAYEESKASVTAIASVCYGTIRNCVFELGAQSDGGKINLFGLQLGVIENSVIKADYSRGEELRVYKNGYGRLINGSVIAPSLSGGTTLFGSDGDLSDVFVDTYYYKDVNSFVNKNGLFVTDKGAGAIKDFGSSDNYDKTTFSVSDGRVRLANEKEKCDYTFTKMEAPARLAATAGVKLGITLPNADGAGVTVAVYDSFNRDVTGETYREGIFEAYRAGDYKMIFSAENGKACYGAATAISVRSEKTEPDSYSYIMRSSDARSITVGGSKIDAAKYACIVKDESVAVVNDGEIRAAGLGETTVTVIDKTDGSSFKLAVKVLADYVEADTAEKLIAALKNSDADSYIAMTADITVSNDMLTYSPEKMKNASGGYDPYYHVWLTKDFYGTLDGQGYKLVINYDNTERSFPEDAEYKKNDRDMMCGMFYSIREKAVVKNLVYEFNAHYVPTTYAIYDYTSAFAFYMYGHVRDCYLKANLNPTKKTRSSEGVIAVGINEKLSYDSSYCYNVLFEINSSFNGETIDSGYAIRFGYQGPSAVDCALIRKGSLKEFFGDRGYHGSAVRGNNNNSYQTIYDFINGINGYNYNGYYNLKKLTDGDKRYAGWSDKWEFSANEIRLCGRKAADVVYEAYEKDDSLAVTEKNGVIEWQNDGVKTAEIYVEDTLVGTTASGKFDLYGVVREKGAGAYRTLIKYDGAACCLVYRVIPVGNADFVNVLRSADTEEAASFKMYVLTEDVEVKPWTNDNLGDFTARFGDARYVTIKTFANIDGNGHSVSTSYYSVKDPTMKFGGIAQYFNGCWRNVVYRVNATYINGGFRFFMGDEAESGSFTDCVFVLNAKTVDGKGNEICDTVRAITVFNNVRSFDCKGCVFAFSGKSNMRYAHRLLVIAELSDTVVITEDENGVICGQTDDPSCVRNVYAVKDSGALIGGGTAIKYDRAQGVVTETTYKDYGLSESFSVKNNALYLLGRKVIEKIVTGDTVIDDSRIY